jgi:heme exporter protein D
VIPELGKYAGAVLGAYGAAIALLGGLVLVSLLRGRSVKRALERQESLRGDRDRA